MRMLTACLHVRFAPRKKIRKNQYTKWISPEKRVLMVHVKNVYKHSLCGHAKYVWHMPFANDISFSLFPRSNRFCWLFTLNLNLNHQTFFIIWIIKVNTHTKAGVHSQSIASFENWSFRLDSPIFYTLTV